jgi:hypothetical protein
LHIEGIESHTIVLHIPQEDGVSENGHRTIVEQANTILQQTNTPKLFSTKAVQTIVYLKNISPTKELQN